MKRFCIIDWYHYHAMDMLWDKFKLILPLYMKPINFQSNASVGYSVTPSRIYWFLPEETKCVSQHIGKETNEYLNFAEQEMKRWSSFCVNYFLRYYLMMQHQPIVQRVNGALKWAHVPYQLISTSYHCCLYKHRRQDERQPPQSSWPVPFVPRHS